MNAATHVLIGRKVCGCAIAFSLDDPLHPELSIIDRKEFEDAGYTVDRVTIEESRKIKYGCDCLKNAKTRWRDIADEQPQDGDDVQAMDDEAIHENGTAVLSDDGTEWLCGAIVISLWRPAPKAAGQGVQDAK